jgi:hypothetical protein
MRFTIDQMPTELSSKNPLNIVQGKGASLRVLHGRIWLTQEGSPDDVFLDGGESYTFSRDGKVVITAEGSPRPVAKLVFESPLTIHSQPSLGARVRQLLA